ncbi:MAG TPA: isopeptide-forming domain-containing fimbrial protein [Cellulomonas sp.]
MTFGTGDGGSTVTIGRPLARVTALLTAIALVLISAVLGAATPAQAADARPTLTIQKTVGATSAEPGDEVVWTVKVTCESISSMCENVVVTDTIPDPFVLGTTSGAVLVDGEVNGQADVVTDGNDVSVTLNETDSTNHPGVSGLRAGQSISVMLTTTLPADTALSWHGTTVVNTAVAAADNADTVSADASIGIVVPVTPTVAATKTFSPTDQIAGDTADVTVTLGAQNTSPVAATALTVTEPAAGTSASFGPGTVLQLRSIGAVTFPEGATGVTVTVTTQTGTGTDAVTGSALLGTFTDGQAIDLGAVDPATVTGVTLQFIGDTDAAGTIVANGAAGSVVLVLGQDATSVSRYETSKVTDVVGVDLTTGRGSASGTAEAGFQINPVLVEVTAGKTFTSSAGAESGAATVVAGETSVVRLTATNSSNTSLSVLQITEPATAGAGPFGTGTTENPLLGFVGFGTDGSGTSDASTWPAGADSATVTITGADGESFDTLVQAPGEDGVVSWPDIPEGFVVTGFTITYSGTIATKAVATVPFLVATDASWTDEHGFTNEVAVDGQAADGTDAEQATASAVLTVLPRRVVTTATKIVTQQVDGAGLPGVVGQQLVATLTGRISRDTTVPVGSLTIEDLAGTDSTLWDAAGLVRIGSVDIPSGSQAEVFVHDRGTDADTWRSIAGPTTDASSLLDLGADDGIDDGVDGVRVVYTPTGTATSLPIDGSFTPKVALLLALSSAQDPSTVLTNTVTSTVDGTGTGDGLVGTDQDSTSLTIGTGTTAVDIRRVDATKSWSTSQALIPVDNTSDDADRPTNQLTMTVQNITGVPVTTLRLTDPNPDDAGNAFDYVDLTSLRVTLPTGATSLQVLLLGADGEVLHTLTSASAVAALTAADLADVVQIEATATGTSIPDNAVLTLVAGTVLRAETRGLDGQAVVAIVGTTDGAAQTSLVNTVRGDLGPSTPDDTDQATTVLYPEALQPLKGSLSKSVSPSTGTRYSATDRTVRLSLTAHRTSSAAVSKPWQYVLEDTSAAFWDAFDLVSLDSLSGITIQDGAGYTASVQYLVNGSWTSMVTSTLGTGTTTTMPVLPDGAADLPDGTTASDVTGVRVTFTAPSGSQFANRTVGGFEGPTALFTLSPRSTLRSTGAEVPTGTLTNVVTGTVQAQYQPTTTTLTPAQATYTVTDGVLDAAVSKTTTSTSVRSGDEVPFTLTVTNTGTAPIVNPVLTDVLPSDANGALLVYDPEDYSSLTLTTSPTSASIGAVTPVITLDGTQIVITFPAGTRLMPGEKLVVTVPLVVRAGTAADSVLVNEFDLTADDGLTRQASAQVKVISQANYLRIKDVSEDLADGATATGVVNVSGSGQACTSTDGFYRQPCLVQTATGGTETWRLRLKNTGNLPTASASLVDVLPYSGDTGTSKSQSTSSRGSSWATEYLGDLQLLDLPDGTTSTVWYLLDGETCTYTGVVTSADPRGTGCADDVWTPAAEVIDLSQVRGIRIDLDFEAAQLQPGEQVTVTFRTRSASDSTASTLGTDAAAWNTMVVTTASVTSGGLSYETLEPNRAGVAVTYQPGSTGGGSDPGTDPTPEPTTDPTTDPTTGPSTEPSTDPTTQPTGAATGGVLADGDGTGTSTSAVLSEGADGLATTGAEGVRTLLVAAGILLLAGAATVVGVTRRRRPLHRH